VSGLTESDLALIARARQAGPALRAQPSDRERLAGWLLAELASLAERLTCDEDAQRLDRIRVVLAKFDWERDDRQLALEEIERIVTGGAR
jgi:hypothetical protein